MITIDDEKFPKILYKYRDWENENEKDKFGRRLLTNSEVYFASVDQFNDPFDGTLPYRFKKEDMTQANIFIKVFAAIKNEFPELSDSEIHKLSYERQYSGIFEDDRYWREYHETFKQHFKNSFGILSLASKRDNILMWSHYANSHSGYCVGLDRDILFDICEAQLSMVTYDNIFPEVGMFEEGPIALIKLTTTKSENWKYEEEIRMVKFTPRKIVEIPSDCVKEVILGCNMARINKQLIQELVKEKYTKANVFDAKINDNEFKLDFLKI